MNDKKPVMLELTFNQSIYLDKLIRRASFNMSDRLLAYPVALNEANIIFVGSSKLVYEEPGHIMRKVIQASLYTAVEAYLGPDIIEDEVDE